MDDCIFCKIIKGEVQADKIYEDEHTLAFLNIRPINHGHALVIPKEHYRNIFDMPEEVFCSLVGPIKKVARAVKEVTGAQGINVSINNEPAAGQVVFHAHFHIIPRFTEDGLKHWGDKKCKDGELEKIAEKIKARLK